MAPSISTNSSFDGDILPRRSINYERVKQLKKPDVYAVRHRESGAVFTASVIDLERTNDDELDQIKCGVKVTRLLKHTNLLPFLSCFVDKNNLWIISPHFELGSASKISKPYGIEDEIMLAYIIRGVLTALDYLHVRALIHRAVRGSHILVGRDGRCVLSGLKYCTSVIRNGRWQQAIHDFPSNATNNLHWLSPEVLEQNLLGYDYKSDIYSLGITCCEISNGVVPFDNLHPTEMLLDKLTGHYPKPLDATSAHLIKFPDGGLTNEDDQKKFDHYKSRRFSDLFHTFTVELCLNSDPHKRPTAAQLLNHRFIKQLKKAPPAICVFGEQARKDRSDSEQSSSVSNMQDSQDEINAQNDNNSEWIF